MSNRLKPLKALPPLGGAKTTEGKKLAPLSSLGGSGGGSQLGGYSLDRLLQGASPSTSTTTSTTTSTLGPLRGRDEDTGSLDDIGNFALGLAQQSTTNNGVNEQQDYAGAGHLTASGSGEQQADSQQSAAPDSQRSSSEDISDVDLDPNYVPTREEIFDYGSFLGMQDLPGADEKFLWIAKKGLTAPIPEPWRPIRTPDESAVYYYNKETQESRWEHPLDDYFKELYQKEVKRAAALPPGQPYSPPAGMVDSQPSSPQSEREDGGDGDGNGGLGKDTDGFRAPTPPKMNDLDSQSEEEIIINGPGHASHSTPRQLDTPIAVSSDLRAIKHEPDRQGELLKLRADHESALAAERERLSREYQLQVEKVRSEMNANMSAEESRLKAEFAEFQREKKTEFADKRRELHAQQQQRLDKMQDNYAEELKAMEFEYADRTKQQKQKAESAQQKEVQRWIDELRAEYQHKFATEWKSSEKATLQRFRQEYVAQEKAKIRREVKSQDLKAQVLQESIDNTEKVDKMLEDTRVQCSQAIKQAEAEAESIVDAAKLKAKQQQQQQQQRPKAAACTVQSHAKLESALGGVKARNDLLLSEKARLSTELRDVNAQVSSLQSELHVLRTETQSLAADKEQLEQQLEDAITQAREQPPSSTGKGGEPLVYTESDMRSVKSEEKEYIESLKEKVAQMGTRLITLQGKMQEARQERVDQYADEDTVVISALQLQLRQAQDDLGQTRTDNDALRAALRSKESALTQAKNEVVQQQTAVSRSQDNEQSLKAQIEMLKGRIDNYSNEKALWETEIQWYQQKLKDVQSEALLSKLDVLEEKVDQQQHGQGKQSETGASAGDKKAVGDDTDGSAAEDQVHFYDAEGTLVAVPTSSLQEQTRRFRALQADMLQRVKDMQSKLEQEREQHEARCLQREAQAVKKAELEREADLARVHARLLVVGDHGYGSDNQPPSSAGETAGADGADDSKIGDSRASPENVAAMWARRCHLLLQESQQLWETQARLREITLVRQAVRKTTLYLYKNRFAQLDTQRGLDHQLQHAQLHEDQMRAGVVPEGKGNGAQGSTTSTALSTDQRDILVDLDGMVRDLCSSIVPLAPTSSGGSDSVRAPAAPVLERFTQQQNSTGASTGKTATAGVNGGSLLDHTGALQRAHQRIRTLEAELSSLSQDYQATTRSLNNDEALLREQNTGLTASVERLKALNAREARINSSRLVELRQRCLRAESAEKDARMNMLAVEKQMLELLRDRKTPPSSSSDTTTATTPATKTPATVTSQGQPLQQTTHSVKHTQGPSMVGDVWPRLSESVCESLKQAEGVLGDLMAVMWEYYGVTEGDLPAFVQRLVSTVLHEQRTKIRRIPMKSLVAQMSSTQSQGASANTGSSLEALGWKTQQCGHDRKSTAALRCSITRSVPYFLRLPVSVQNVLNSRDWSRAPPQPTATTSYPAHETKTPVSYPEIRQMVFSQPAQVSDPSTQQASESVKRALSSLQSACKDVLECDLLPGETLSSMGHVVEQYVRATGDALREEQTSISRDKKIWIEDKLAAANLEKQVNDAKTSGAAVEEKKTRLDNLCTMLQTRKIALESRVNWFNKYTRAHKAVKVWLRSQWRPRSSASQRPDSAPVQVCAHLLKLVRWCEWMAADVFTHRVSKSSKYTSSHSSKQHRSQRHSRASHRYSSSESSTPPSHRRHKSSRRREYRRSPRGYVVREMPLRRPHTQYLMPPPPHMYTHQPPQHYVAPYYMYPPAPTYVHPQTRYMAPETKTSVVQAGPADRVIGSQKPHQAPAATENPAPAPSVHATPEISANSLSSRHRDLLAVDDGSYKSDAKPQTASPAATGAGGTDPNGEEDALQPSFDVDQLSFGSDILSPQ